VASEAEAEMGAAVVGAAEKPDKPDYFKNIVIVLLTFVSVFVAAVTFLQNYASLRSSDLGEQSSFKAVNATGLLFSAGLKSAQGAEALQRYGDAVQKSVQADTKAKALLMAGKADLATASQLDVERWRQAADQIASQSEVIRNFHSDTALYNETLSRDGYVDEEREQTLLQQSRDWSDKANGYVAVLSTLSVALFLAGLSLTLSSWVRFILAAAGVVLTITCLVWVLVLLIQPVAVIPEAAIQRFVDGRIHYTLDTQRGSDYTDAIADFDAAVHLAPAYGQAYFYRSRANTDASLTGKHLDTQQAINDAKQAIALGDTISSVYGNLGWLYYLNGQYNSALSNTESALSMSPNDCYLPFNQGLTLLALNRAQLAADAYNVAIDCAERQSSAARFTNYLDSGVTDLNDLAAARPDLQPIVQSAIRKLKEALAQTRTYGQLKPNPVGAQFEPLTFGTSLDADGNVTGTADQFPQTTTILYAQLKYAGMQKHNTWMARWLLNGIEYLTTVYPTWDYEAGGNAWVSLSNNAGLNSGDYHLDLFVDGQLVQSGDVQVLPGNLPPMSSYTSYDVGVTVSYPMSWTTSDLADNQVSVVAARDPGSLSFFGVTAWVAHDDAQLFQLFQLYLDALKKDSTDFSTQNRTQSTVAGLGGWSQSYQYTDQNGQTIDGTLAGVIDAQKKYGYIVVIEAKSGDWDSLNNLFTVMLNRMQITASQ
jgi:tetratricopeptide (TPR) repeat protein